MGFSSKNIGVGCHFLLQSQPMDWTRFSCIVGRFFTASATEELFLTLFSFNTYAAAAAKSLQSCPTLCNPIDGSLPGSPVPGILQARTLEWVAIAFSNAWKWKVKVKLLSRVWLFATPWTAAYQAPPSMGFSRQEYWSGVPSPSPIYIYVYIILIFCSFFLFRLRVCYRPHASFPPDISVLFSKNENIPLHNHSKKFKILEK